MNIGPALRYSTPNPHSALSSSGSCTEFARRPEIPLCEGSRRNRMKNAAKNNTHDHRPNQALPIGPQLQALLRPDSRGWGFYCQKCGRHFDSIARFLSHLAACAPELAAKSTATPAPAKQLELADFLAPKANP
jgi:hypothetical protein